MGKKLGITAIGESTTIGWYNGSAHTDELDASVPKMVEKKIEDDTGVEVAIDNQGVASTQVAYHISSTTRPGGTTNLASRNTNVCLINLGINDAVFGNDSTFLTNFGYLLENIKRTGKIAYVIHPNKISDGNYFHNVELSQIANHITTVCAAKGAILCTSGLQDVSRVYNGVEDAYHPTNTLAGYGNLGAEMAAEVAGDAVFISNMVRVVGMYIACFNKTAEKGGLDYWVGQFASHTRDYVGEALSDAGLGYNISDSDFITTLYTNLMNRVPDSLGMTYWLGVMASAGSEKHGVVMNQIIDRLFEEDSGSDQNDIDIYRHRVACGMAYGHIFGKTTPASAGNLSNVTEDPADVVVFTASL